MVRMMALLALATAAGSTGGYWYGHRMSLAQRWHYRLAITPDAEIADRLAEMVGQPDGAIEALVLGMEMPRENVALQVRKTLGEQMTAWRKLPPADAGRRMSQLATALSQNVERFGPDAKAVAAELVTEILRWNEEGETSERMNLLAACDRVLQVCAPPGSPVAEKLRAEEADSARKNHGLDIEAHFAGISLQPQKAAILPGGGLKVDPARSEDAESLDPTMQAKTKDATEPKRLAGNHAAQPLPAGENTMRTASAIDNTTSADEAAGSEGGDRMARGTRSAANRFASLLHNQSVVELCSMLHAEEPQILDGAASELKRRGVSPRHVELGKRLTDPDPKERRRWAELLPRMAGIDAKPWLLWLSHDQDSDVRLAVVTLMATSGDPDMLSRVSQMGRDDEDPRIQDQAARFAEGAKASRR
jgi:hypothetical protein